MKTCPTSSRGFVRTPVLLTGKRGLRRITRQQPPTPLYLGTNRQHLISCRAFRVVPAPSWSWAGAGCSQWALTPGAQRTQNLRDQDKQQFNAKEKICVNVNLLVPICSSLILCESKHFNRTLFVISINNSKSMRKCTMNRISKCECSVDRIGHPGSSSCLRLQRGSHAWLPILS